MFQSFLATLLAVGAWHAIAGNDCAHCGKAPQPLSEDAIDQLMRETNKVISQNSCGGKGAKAASGQELRGVWVSNVGSRVMDTREGIDAAMEDIKGMGLNTVYPVVWNKGAMFFGGKNRDKFASRFGATPYGRGSGATLPEREVLGTMVDSAKKRGLKVVPWFEYGLKVHARGNPAFTAQNMKNGLFTRKHGSAGKQAYVHRAFGYEFLYLNPFNEAAQDQIISLVHDVVKTQGVDGIQFDDHFSLPVDFGYDDYTLAKYRKEVGLSAGSKFPPPPPPRRAQIACKPGENPDACLERKRADCRAHEAKLNAWRSQWDNPKKPELRKEWRKWVDWRADKFSAFVRRLAKHVRTVSPKSKIVLSPNFLDMSRESYLQDWMKWVRDGSIDELVIQVYQKDIAEFQRSLSKPEVKAALDCVPVSIAVLPTVKEDSQIRLVDACVDDPSLRVRKKSLPTTSKLVNAIRGYGNGRKLNGFSFFEYERLHQEVALQRQAESRLKQEIATAKTQRDRLKGRLQFEQYLDPFNTWESSIEIDSQPRLKEQDERIRQAQAKLNAQKKKALESHVRAQK